MQRSSGSIASLAAALAKAQIELSNPEKSLIGSIEGKAPNAPERLFRYASLASGLDIVRKTLGQKRRGGAEPPSIHSLPPGVCGLRRIRNWLHQGEATSPAPTLQAAM
jgi:hypothetical protein